MSNKKKSSERCDVVRDLMVLCIDGAASEASQHKVRRHMAECRPCRRVWIDMQATLAAEPPAPVEDKQFDEAMRMVRKKQKWRSMWKVLLGVLLAAIVLLAGLAAWWYWGEQVDISLYKHYHTMCMRYDVDDNVYIRVSNVPENARLQVCVNPETGSLLAWITSNRATDWYTAPLGDRDYFIGRVENVHVDEGGLTTRKIALTDASGVTYRMWVRETIQGSVNHLDVGFDEEQINVSRPAQLGRTNIMVSREFGRYIMAQPTPPTTMLPSGMIDASPALDAADEWAAMLTCTPEPAEKWQYVITVCTPEPAEADTFPDVTPMPEVAECSPTPLPAEVN